MIVINKKLHLNKYLNMYLNQIEHILFKCIQIQND